jgi:hypothetical protein
MKDPVQWRTGGVCRGASRARAEHHQPRVPCVTEAVPRRTSALSALSAVEVIGAVTPHARRRSAATSLLVTIRSVELATLRTSLRFHGESRRHRPRRPDMACASRRRNALPRGRTTGARRSRCPCTRFLRRARRRPLRGPASGSFGRRSMGGERSRGRAPPGHSAAGSRVQGRDHDMEITPQHGAEVLDVGAEQGFCARVVGPAVPDDEDPTTLHHLSTSTHKLVVHQAVNIGRKTRGSRDSGPPWGIWWSARHRTGPSRTRTVRKRLLASEDASPAATQPMA